MNSTIAYTYLTNMSMIKASNEIYNQAFGIYFWPIIFIFTLVVVAIKTESPAYVAFYAILGNLALAKFLPISTHPIFYTTIVLSIAMTLYAIFFSKKTD